MNHALSPAAGPTRNEVRATTRLYALLGDPVAHSLSPAIQNAAFEAAGVDARYLALRVAETDVPGLLRGVARAGGGGNVTIPHKGLAARTVEVPSEAVRLTGSCNTFWLAGGKIHGDNTDVEGFRGAMRDLLGGSPRGARVLLLGAGGAARAALSVLLEEGTGEVAVLNRTLRRSVAMAEALGPDGVRVLTRPAEARKGRWELVVNATSLGLNDADPDPLPLGDESQVGAVLDLVYRPGETPWVRRARMRGIPAADGRTMLVHQGAAAFERWFDRPAPVEVMRAAFEGAGGRGEG